MHGRAAARGVLPIGRTVDLGLGPDRVAAQICWDCDRDGCRSEVCFERGSLVLSVLTVVCPTPNPWKMLLVQMKMEERVSHCTNGMMATEDDRPWEDRTWLVFAVILTGTDRPIGASPEWVVLMMEHHMLVLRWSVERGAPTV
ncbi:hypothetical protein ACLOJK_029213 [Asimina triloba]